MCRPRVRPQALREPVSWICEASSERDATDSRIAKAIPTRGWPSRKATGLTRARQLDCKAIQRESQSDPAGRNRATGTKPLTQPLSPGRGLSPLRTPSSLSTEVRENGCGPIAHGIERLLRTRSAVAWPRVPQGEYTLMPSHEGRRHTLIPFREVRSPAAWLVRIRHRAIECVRPRVRPQALRRTVGSAVLDLRSVHVGLASKSPRDRQSTSLVTTSRLSAAPGLGRCRPVRKQFRRRGSITALA